MTEALQPPVRPHRVKKIVEKVAVGGALLGALAGGAKVGLEKFNGPDKALAPITSPEFSQTPEASPTFEYPTPGTGDLEMQEGVPIPLGIVEKRYNKAHGIATALTTGVVKDIYRKTLVLNNGEETFNFISVDFGANQKGERVIGELVLGRDREIIAQANIIGWKVLERRTDPVYTSKPTELRMRSTPAKKVASLLKIGRQYGFSLSLSHEPRAIPKDCDQSAQCRDGLALAKKYSPGNNEIVKALEGNQPETGQFTGYTSIIFVPPHLQR